MTEWAWIIGLSCSCFVGIALTAVRLPGTWWIAATAVGYAWWLGFPQGCAWPLTLLVAAAVAGEIVEFIGSLVLSNRAGASKYAGWGGIAGGLLGAIFLSFVVPIPILGTMAGALLGCFLGASVVEFSARRRLDQGARVGFFAALGFVLGTAAKVAVAMAMSSAFLSWVLLQQAQKV